MDEHERRAFNQKNIAEFRASGGRISSFGDAPVLLLTTIGAKSGERRVVQRDAVTPEGAAGGEQPLAERAAELVEGAPACGCDLAGVGRRELLVLLERHDGNLADVAREMGKARMQVHRWLKRFGIDPNTFRR